VSELDSIKTDLAGIELEHPVGIAAGMCKEVGHVREVARSAAAFINVGSFTVNEREGNKGSVDYDGGDYFLNSIGLKNCGSKRLAQLLPEMVSIAHGHGKPLFGSAAGNSPHEYGELALLMFEKKVDLITLNCGCPNIWGTDGQKTIASYHPELLSQILSCVKDEIGSPPPIPVAVKLSPFIFDTSMLSHFPSEVITNNIPLMDFSVFKQVIQAIVTSGIVSVVVTSNTVPNALVYDKTGKPVITPGEGLAGLSGKAIKRISFQQIAWLKDLLPENIQIAGVGGITTGQDVKDFKDAGATAMKVASHFYIHGPQVFSEILQEYVDLIE